LWFDELAPDASWSSLWNGYIICGRCGGIRRYEGPCPGCGGDPLKCEELVVVLEDGTEERVLLAQMGAEGRYEDYVYLRLIEREWKRPLLATDSIQGLGPGEPPSPRAAIVLLFWSYFETRIERLLRSGMTGSQPPLIDDALDRYSSIGSRLDRLYRVVFGTTYGADLTDLGYGTVWSHLCELQQRRNSFMHGSPGAVDDHLVERVVAEMKNEHESWIAIFNRHRPKPGA